LKTGQITMIKYRINKGFIIQKIGRKTAIFDGEKSLLYTFNETASLIFRKLTAGWDIKKISVLLVKKYGLDEKRAGKDIRNLITDLKYKKIIQTM